MAEVKEYTREHFLAEVEKARGLNGPSWLRDIRNEGARAFHETEFPHHRMEDWRFTNVTPVVKTPFRTILNAPSREVIAAEVQPHLFDEDWTQLVFVDGFYSPGLSRAGKLPGGVIMTSLAEAVKTDEAAVKAHLNRSLDQKTAFTTLNAALLRDGAYLRVPKGVVLDTPVHFLFASTGAEQTATYPRGLFIFDESSQAILLESHVGLSGEHAYLSNGVSEFVLGPNARLTRYRVVREVGQGYHLNTARVSQGRDSYFESFAITLEGQIVRNELRVLLEGEGAECALNGLYLNDGKRLIDNPLFVDHAAARCRSRMGYKGILDGESAAVFTGKVIVRKGSQKTDSNQLNNNLLLSDQATIDTKPQLEIYADDVKCTHGATIGGFPNELIFYFQSRGIDAAKANGILTFGFAEEVVDQIQVEPLKERLRDYIYDKYSPY